MKRGKPTDDGKVLDSEDAEGEGASMAPATNGYDGARMMAFIEEYEETQAKIESIMDEAKTQCQPWRQEQPKILKRAAEEGFSKKEFRAHLTRRRKQYEADHAADSLDLEQRANFDLMGEALAKHLGTFADTDLGRAATGMA